MYPVRTPALVRNLFKGCVWRMPAKENVLYLTFDDGPEPSITPWVLDTLAKHGAKATFFCIGRNCATHPMLLNRIRTEGHTIGNHTYDHIKGLQTTNRNYLRNVVQCQAITGTRLFRPPYLSLGPAQYHILKKHYNIVLCDVLSGDFDTTLEGLQVWQNVRKNAGPGSIVIFHDSLKGAPRLRHALPLTLDHFCKLGYTFRSLEELA